MGIRDSRLLEFDEYAIGDALIRCGRQAALLGVTGDSIGSVEIGGDRQEVIIRTGTGRDEAVVIIAATRMVALLIAYCIRLGIPLPRKAGKQVSIFNNRVVIAFSRSHATASDGASRATTSTLAADGRAVSWR